MLGAGCVLVVTAAHAQDSAAAEALFNRGVADMEAGKLQSACPAIAESQRLDPRAGTLFTLAECQAKAGNVASAVAHYQDYAGLVSRLPPDQRTRHADRVTRALAAVTRIKPTVPTLSINLPADAPSGTTVARDGVTLQGASLGVPLPVDPGEHVIITQVPGGPEHRVTVKLALADNRTMITEIEGPPAPANAPVTAAEKKSSNSDGVSPRSNGSSRTIAWVAGGVGVVGLGVGTVTGLMVLGDAGTVRENCDGAVCRNAQGTEAAERGKSLATVSSIAFGVGLAGIATSAVLLLSTRSAPPKPDRAHATWQPIASGDSTGAWVGVRGNF
jgi:hypothetical protein